MTEAEIIAGIGAVARKHLKWEGQLEAEDRLVEDLQLDSLKALTLAVEVENLFRVRLDPEVESKISTIGDLVSAIRSQLND